MAEDLAGLLVALGLVALVCDGLWAAVSLVLDAFRPPPPAPAEVARIRTFRPGRITIHRDGTLTVEEVETTPRRSTGG